MPVGRALDPPSPSGRVQPFVDLEPKQRWHSQEGFIDQLGAYPKVGMMACTEWERACPAIAGSRLNRESIGRKAVVDQQIQAEGVPRLWVQVQPHLHPVLIALHRPPVHPAGKPVNRVVSLRLGERGLVCVAPEFVSPVLEAVRPGEQGCPAGRAAHLVLAVAVEDLPFAGLVASQSCPHLGHHCYLAAERNPVLFARRRVEGHR